MQDGCWQLPNYDIELQCLPAGSRVAGIDLISQHYWPAHHRSTTPRCQLRPLQNNPALEWSGLALTKLTAVLD